MIALNSISPDQELEASKAKIAAMEAKNTALEENQRQIQAQMQAFMVSVLLKLLLCLFFYMKIAGEIILVSLSS